MVLFPGSPSKVFYMAGAVRCFWWQAPGHLFQDCPFNQQQGAPQDPTEKMGATTISTLGTLALATTLPPT